MLCLKTYLTQTGPNTTPSQTKAVVHGDMNDDQQNSSNQIDRPDSTACSHSRIWSLKFMWNKLLNSDPADFGLDEIMHYLKWWEGPDMIKGVPYV